MTVLVRPDAAADIEEAHLWYVNLGVELGTDFLAAMREAVEHITENPKAYPVLWRETRRIRLRRFPYGLFYRLYGDTVVLVACMHAARDPQTWQQR